MRKEVRTVVCDHCLERVDVSKVDSDQLCPKCASVGRLIPWTSDGFVLCCEDCYLHGRPDHVSLVTSHPNASKVYRINVFPYKGTCHFCSKTLVEPATNGWPELFNGRGSEREYPKPDAKVVDLTHLYAALMSTTDLNHYHAILSTLKSAGFVEDLGHFLRITEKGIALAKELEEALERSKR